MNVTFTYVHNTLMNLFSLLVSPCIVIFQSFSKKKSSSMSKNPVLPPSDVPAGTTWVFEDGSQVSKCEKNDTAEHGDNKGM